jgi:hypothetical protein
VTEPDPDLVEHGGLGLDRSISRRTVVEMLLGGPPHRLNTLGYLLDATTVAVSRGAPVALVAEDLQQAATWLAAISYFYGPDITTRLAGSGPARIADLASGVHRGLVNLVPRSTCPGGLQTSGLTPNSLPPGLTAQVVETSEEVTRARSPPYLLGEPVRAAGGGHRMVDVGDGGVFLRNLRADGTADRTGPGLSDGGA